MIHQLNLKALLLFACCAIASVGLVIWATTDSWGAARESKKPEQVYKPSVRHHGSRHYYFYSPSRSYRGFYDGGPGTPK